MNDVFAKLNVYTYRQSCTCIHLSTCSFKARMHTHTHTYTLPTQSYLNNKRSKEAKQSKKKKLCLIKFPWNGNAPLFNNMKSIHGYIHRYTFNEIHCMSLSFIQRFVLLSLSPFLPLNLVVRAHKTFIT